MDIKRGDKQNTISITLQVTYLGSQSDYQNLVKGFLSQLPRASASKSTPQSYLATLQSLAGNQNLNTSLASDYSVSSNGPTGGCASLSESDAVPRHPI